MNQEITIPFKEVSFKNYILNKANRNILWLSMAFIIIQFTIFKYFYPFASYIHGDSFLYITAARDNSDINTHMIGYSKFLRLFSVFSKSDTILVVVQYLLIQISSFFLLFTLFYFYNPRKTSKLLLITVVTINPLALYLANLISSDNLFLSTSLIWFALLLWTLHKPSIIVVFLHVLFLFLAFTIRYNGLLYPFVSLAIILLSRVSVQIKTASIVTLLACCSLFVIHTSAKYKDLTGHWQYSPFSGWQWANNAMYTYRYVDSSSRRPLPIKYKGLDTMIRNYFDSRRNANKFQVEKVIAGTFYMWSPGLPLHRYARKQFPNDTSSFYLKKWASMGPFYGDYGRTVIKKYPIHFVKYFLWPNSKKYFTPPLEYLRTFNSERNYVSPTAKDWFNYKSRIINTKTKNLNNSLLIFFPNLFGAVNILFLCSLIPFIVLKKRLYEPIIQKGVWVAGGIWAANLVFSIFASSIALRFQTFPLYLTFFFSVLLIDIAIQMWYNIQPTDKLNPGRRISKKDLQQSIG